MRVAILDYGAGNLYSLTRAVAAAGSEAVITADIGVALKSDAMILPGVGSFGSAASFFEPFAGEIREALANGFPCLAICLGMQLLFESSEEGEGSGIGAVKGRVRKLNAVRVPQIGWNTLENATDPLIASASLETAYFANSFVCEPADTGIITSWATHEADRFAASVRTNNTVGVQFHPEKSSAAGVAFVAAFLKARAP